MQYSICQSVKIDDIIGYFICKIMHQILYEFDPQ